jgi:hypothetical protein
MKFELFKEVAFARDYPERGIKKGDVATVLDYLEDPEPGYALEVFDALGNTVDVFAVAERYLEPLQKGERWQVRHVEA